MLIIWVFFFFGFGERGIGFGEEQSKKSAMASTNKVVSGGGSLISDLKNLFCVLRTRRTMVFAYGFMFAFIACTVFIAFNPSATSSPWFTNIFGSRSSDSSYRTHFSSLFSYFLPNTSQPIIGSTQAIVPPPLPRTDLKGFTVPVAKQFQTAENQSEISTPTSVKSPPLYKNDSSKNRTETSSGKAKSQAPPLKTQPLKNGTVSGSAKPTPKSPPMDNRGVPKNKKEDSSSGMTLGKTQAQAGNQAEKKVSGQATNLLSSMMDCNIFDGRWVEDGSYPLYPPGSCPHIDEPFNCYLNSRPDGAYQKFRWQPRNCNIPRLNGRDMLELLRGKRLVFVGDSLNRNMWESLVCILRNSVQDKSKVFEASGRKEFRTDGSYSFLFKDYNCSVEFFQSPFLVQEWEMPDTNGSKKETLRLDIVERSSDEYKNADIIVFNTGHWWTHEKTSKGRGYYQEGSHIYDELNVAEAFRRAVTTWSRWVDANVNPKKTLVFFRGYSASHFSGGQWNSGGQCDNETEPIKNETYLSAYPEKMAVLESVIKWMKTPISYLNITRMTDYRKDAHPSIYRKQYFTDEERRSPLRYQDCSHWCLPGVPDSWNELLYAQLLIKYNQKQQQQQQKRP
ncbi:hypothetical protein NE237_003175 [Protea cynaroides]|uniref:Trichome birefringence-like N-terminal domain-containing protein n=1 Tax=Protea cynaroides TaxID=273540 RepID=A0A9Q0KGJ7_9MAGN|nr:hypothetical protein NE237_003175 [Protea cynaroides]